MKQDIHPAFHPEARVVCVCGSTFTAGSTLPEIHVEICSACHPFYTGKQKLVDTARRVEKFQERSEKSKITVRGGKKKKLVKRAARREAAKAKTDEEKQNAAAIKKMVKS